MCNTVYWQAKHSKLQSWCWVWSEGLFCDISCSSVSHTLFEITIFFALATLLDIGCTFCSKLKKITIHTMCFLFCMIFLLFLYFYLSLEFVVRNFTCRNLCMYSNSLSMYWLVECGNLILDSTWSRTWVSTRWFDYITVCTKFNVTCNEVTRCRMWFAEHMFWHYNSFSLKSQLWKCNGLSSSCGGLWWIFIWIICSFSATVHFQHSAELVKLLSESNVNYTLQVTAAISSLSDDSFHFINKGKPWCCVNGSNKQHP